MVFSLQHKANWDWRDTMTVVLYGMTFVVASPSALLALQKQLETQYQQSA